MTTTPYELIQTPDGVTAQVHVRGPAVLGASGINRGTAFTLAQREALGLTGLLPTGCQHTGGPAAPGLRPVPGAGQ